MKDNEGKWCGCERTRVRDVASRKIISNEHKNVLTTTMTIATMTRRQQAG